MPAHIERIQPEYLVIGEILRPHGVNGELRMRVITDYPERLPELETVFVGKSADDKRLREIAVKNVRFNKSFALLTLDGYRSRSDADQLRSKIVMVPIDNATPLDEGEYYLFQLIGLTVVADGYEIGVVKEVMQTGANDVYVVTSEAHGEILVPAHQDTIVSIDFDTEMIAMTLPDGLLSAN